MQSEQRTAKLFRSSPYSKSCESVVLETSANGEVVVDQTVFYAAGGGQPGDSGNLLWENNHVRIVDARYAEDGAIKLLPEAGSPVPNPGDKVRQELDWDRRYQHMRIHTALHLLSVAIPLPVTSGAITAEKGRLDFDMPESIQDRDALERKLNELVSLDLPVTEDWISDDELEANPSLIKTMSVKPPLGSGWVRLVRIGGCGEQIDLQPCGGTHVANTAEIGTIRLGKIEKKGRRNRRVNIFVD